MAADAAFEILYREYYPRVYGLCRRLLNADASAEDATQEVFMRAYRQFKRYDTSRPFWQWIATISSNYCIDVLRKHTAQDFKSDLVAGFTVGVMLVPQGRV